MARRTRPALDREATRAPERPGAATAAPAMALLALQRTAGNAAVSAYLARKRSIPEDADQLEDVASAAPDMIIDTTEMKVGAIKEWVAAARGEDRPGYSVDIRIADPMASQPQVRKALTAMAMAFFNLRKGITRAALVDQVKLLDLDFSSFGGTDGHYCFTCVIATPAAGGK